MSTVDLDAKKAARSDREELIRKAVDSSQTNALRLALYQTTRDPALANLKLDRLAVRGGAQFQIVVAAEDIPVLKDKVVRYLLNPPLPVPPPPEPAETRELLQMFCGRALSENFIRFGMEELAFDPFPRDVHWSKTADPKLRTDINVLVVGGGISGLAAAVQLKRLGIPFEVVERQGGIGGTWQRNIYPGARVDTSSFMYQFKFEKNYPWTEYFASRAETKRYVEYIAAKHGVVSNFRFNTEVTAAHWDEARARWIVTLRDADGSEETRNANFIITGSGLFSTIKLPNIPGIEDFQGKIFHSTQWDPHYSYAGKRIAVIGTGSTGVQLMPELAEAAGQLTVYQRTANWIAAAPGYRSRVSEEARFLFDGIPYYWNWYCFASFDTSIQLQNAQTYDHEWRKSHAGVSEANEKIKATLVDYIHNRLGDREDLIRKCMPDHPPLARRLVVDNGFYDALLKPTVELVTEEIEGVTPSGIRSRDGVTREFDLIVLASGFHVTKYLAPVDYVGRDEMTLDRAWARDGARSYLGMAMPGFPNLLMMYGPNGQPRSGGFYSWAEIWARYACALIVETIEGNWRSFDVKDEVFEDYNKRLDQADKEILWAQEGSKSYFVNQFGRSAVNIAFRTEDYHAMVAKPDLNDFVMKR